MTNTTKTRAMAFLAALAVLTGVCATQPTLADTTTYYLEGTVGPGGGTAKTVVVDTKYDTDWTFDVTVGGEPDDLYLWVLTTNRGRCHKALSTVHVENPRGSATYKLDAGPPGKYCARVVLQGERGDWFKATVTPPQAVETSPLDELDPLLGD